jgi:hypothetical protein
MGINIWYKREMRKKNLKQLPLMGPTYDYAEEAKLDMITRMIDCTPNITEYVLQDLNGNKPCKQATGAEGMSADQVVRACIVKHLYGFSYEKLAFHIYDSRSLRKFCRIGFADNGFSKAKGQDKNDRYSEGREIKDVCFAKKRGLKETDMCRSEYIYKKLRQFRAGIESGISWLNAASGCHDVHGKGLSPLSAMSFHQWLRLIS